MWYYFTRISVIPAIAPIVRGFVEFNGDTIKDAGIYYFAEEMNLHSKIEVHTVVSDVETRKRVDSLFEAGMKFGIRSNVISIKNTAKGITQDDHGSVEGVISSAFRGWKLYHDVLKLFSSNANFGISGGLWFFVHGEYSKSESRAVTEIPSILNVTKLNSTSDELSFKGTQVTAYEAYIETKYAKSDAAKSTYDASSKRGSFDLDIPVYGNVPASLSAEISKGKVKIEKNLRTQIYVSGRCKLDVSIRADLKGFSLSARELEANFNDLVLESLQDIIESKAWGAGVGIGLDGKDMPKLDNIKGSLQDRSMHVVESLSEILGSDPEKTKIVVANALRLNGAIVANAEKDENGNYTDHGNLVLTVGYLFIKHIYDYDRGKTLSASFSMGSDIKLHDQKGKDIPFMSLEATLAGHDKDGYTRATIGKSNNITITGNPEELEKANRDLSKVQTWNTHYDIKEIFLYYSNIDTKALKAGIPDTPEAWVKGVSQYVKSTLLPNSQSNVVLTEEQLEAIKAKAEENIQKLKNKAKNLSKKDKTEITEHNEKQISEVNKVKQELDHIQNDYASGKITEKSAKTKILENTAELIRDTGAKYVEFAEKHPTLAEYGLSGLNIAVQTAIGSIAGFINSIKSEALGRAIGASIGESISSLINGRVAEAATIIKNTNPELDEGDATSLATGLVLGGILVAFGTMGAKQLLKDLSKIKVPNSILKSVMSSITHEQKAALDSLKNIKISPNTLAQKVKESQLFKQHFNGKPAKLDFHEGRSHDGHTLSKHVSTGSLEKNIKFLVKRNMDNPLPDSISSMYPSKEVAEKVTNEVLLHNEAPILKWFKNKHFGSGKGFEFDFKQTIGYGVRKDVNNLETLKKGYVYLKKTKDGIKIQSSYPII